jgi:hypothetical protein
MNMKPIKTFFLLALAVAACQTAAAPAAATRNDIPSCRTLFKLEEVPAARDYLILIDQTTLLNPALAKDASERILRSIKPGDRVEIVSFSGLNPEHFLLTEFDGRLDVPPTDSERGTAIPAALLRKAEACFAKQTVLARKKVGDTLGRLLGKPLEDSPGRSEILKAVASVAAQGIKSPESLMLIVSDMVENNDVFSFYGKQGLAVPAADAALTTAKRYGLLADLHGARVFVIGAGYSSDDKYAPSLKVRENLRQFWLALFTSSNATLSAWGDPALVGDIL